MLPLDDFYRIYQTLRPRPNDEQCKIVNAPSGYPLFIVAGPGTGKTATLTLRILKLILVDGVPPQGILATTFTKKAAGELRSRILGWGFRLQQALLDDSEIVTTTRQWVSRIDINQVTTGTIDSICEQLLREFRDPAMQPPVLADEFVSATLLLREGFFLNASHRDDDLDTLLYKLSGQTSRWGWNTATKNDLVLNIWERRFQDQVNWNAFIQDYAFANPRALKLLDQVLCGYQQALEARGMLDFSLLEQRFLDLLRQGQPESFLQNLRVVLVDEYQDTNLLQESIYFALADHCSGALTVVGDDDQSLYRFRGATVELFSGFAQRYAQVFDREVKPIFLRTNYRSTHSVVDFVNTYAHLDGAFQAVRVSDKPALLPSSGADEGIPILAMFRHDPAALAGDLADFVHAVFRGRGYQLSNGQMIRCAEGSGDLGDCALLCSSPAEYNSSDKPRLPWYLRRALGEHGIEVFNPRGQTLTEVPLIMVYGGLLLEALDPGAVLQSTTSGLNDDMTTTLDAWRAGAISFVQSIDAPPGLLDFAIGWAERNPGRPGWEWPRSTPVLDLLYGLLHFFPLLYDDPEGQIYLEIFTRQVTACMQVGKFSGRVVHDPSDHNLGQASVKELLRNFLGPIAGGAVKVNEELMDAFPRDRFNILSIHQSKGLEFPLVMVDAGSDFKTNHPAHAFKRFPQQGSRAHVLENALRPFTPLGMPNRDQADRAFDDLYRQFFVAYSRPQQVLLLIGHGATRPGGSVENVATGWRRNGTCSWQRPLPFLEI